MIESEGISQSHSIILLRFAYSNHLNSKFSSSSDSNGIEFAQDISICKLTRIFVGHSWNGNDCTLEFPEAALLTPQSVRSFHLYLLSSALFPLAPRLPRSRYRLQTHRETLLHQRATHVNAITSKMNPPHGLRDNFPRACVPHRCVCCKQISFCRYVWRALSFIGRKPNAQYVFAHSA